MPSLLQGAVTHLWQFDDTPGFLEDSVGDATLSVTGNPPQSPIPNSGPGSSFGGLGGNTDLVDLSEGGGFSAILTTSNDFTLEAMVHFDSIAGSFGHMIAGFAASQSNADINWILQGRNVGQGFHLVLFISPEVGSAEFIDSGMPLVAGVDYYVAAAYDSSGSATFWLQDLSADGPLESSVINHQFAGSALAQNTNIFQIATLGSLGLAGVIDEVRLSDSPLTGEQLYIPEPTNGALAGFALLVIGMRRRRA